MQDLIPTARKKLENQQIDETLPGLGQFYCVHCARYFISDQAMTTHLTSKQHKKRVK